MRLTIRFSDGRTEEVTPAPADLVRFERHYKMAAGKIEEDQRIEYVMFLAWCALSRTGKTTDEFDAWLDTLAEIDDDEEVTSAGPPLPPPG